MVRRTARRGSGMLDSLQLEAMLLRLGFEAVETKTHAVGFEHPGLPWRLYLKDRRGRLAEPRKAASRQPLVVHPDVQQLAGFESTRVAKLVPNREYMNGNMSAFPAHHGGSASGVAVDVPDAAALNELLAVMGMQSSGGGQRRTSMRQLTFRSMKQSVLL